MAFAFKVAGTAAAVLLEQAIFAPPVAAMNQVGDSVCVEGFVMDVFCIDRGTLFDNPSVVTLENPKVHSYHCLLDVPQCLATDYEILIDPPEGTTTYCRGFRLDSAGKDAVIAAARAEGERGFCSTCSGASGSPTNGYRATVRGKVVTAASGSTPAIITADEVVSQTDEGEYGCGFETATPPDTCITSSSSNLVNRFYIHGSLMMFGWGVLLPSGVIVARLFRHRPDGLWFKIHRPLQIVGLMFALAGFIVALMSFQVFGKENRGKGLSQAPSYVHGCLGVTVMAIGLTQPLNALIRPHPPEEGEKKSAFRAAWEVWHKGLGYIGVLLSIATIAIGTTLLPTKDVQRQFQMAYGIGCGLLWLIMCIGMVYDKKTYVAPQDK